MAKATVHSLTQKEQALVAETRPPRLRELDEDALADLLVRVRRARDKNVGLHRREVAEQVEAKRARGSAGLGARRSASKAEIFEDALARVSYALAKAARHSAAELKAERLAEARGTTPAAGSARRGAAAEPASTPSTKSRAARPVERKAVASTRAKGDRKQAKRDAR